MKKQVKTPLTPAEMGRKGGPIAARRNRTARTLADALLAYVGNPANAERAALLPPDVLAALAAYRAACGK